MASNTTPLDLAILLDCSRSMQGSLAVIRDTVIPEFTRYMQAEPGTGIIRVKLCGYRDAVRDGERWWVESAFTENPAEVRDHVDTLVATGGEDGLRSLLEGLRKIISLPCTAENEPPRSDAWRHTRRALRGILVLTDGDIRIENSTAGEMAAAFEDINRLLYACRIAFLLVVCPETEAYHAFSVLDAVEVVFVDAPGALPGFLMQSNVIDLIRRRLNYVMQVRSELAYEDLE